jgi:hypothetical protein
MAQVPWFGRTVDHLCRMKECGENGIRSCSRLGHASPSFAKNPSTSMCSYHQHTVHFSLPLIPQTKMKLPGLPVVLFIGANFIGGLMALGKNCKGSSECHFWIRPDTIGGMLVVMERHAKVHGNHAFRDLGRFLNLQSPVNCQQRGPITSNTKPSNRVGCTK